MFEPRELELAGVALQVVHVLEVIRHDVRLPHVAVDPRAEPLQRVRAVEESVDLIELCLLLRLAKALRSRHRQLEALVPWDDRTAGNILLLILFGGLPFGPLEPRSTALEVFDAGQHSLVGLLLNRTFAMSLQSPAISKA